MRVLVLMLALGLAIEAHQYYPRHYFITADCYSKNANTKIARLDSGEFSMEVTVPEHLERPSTDVFSHNVRSSKVNQLLMFPPLFAWQMRLELAAETIDKWGSRCCSKTANITLDISLGQSTWLASDPNIFEPILKCKKWGVSCIWPSELRQCYIRKMMQGSTFDRNMTRVEKRQSTESFFALDRSKMSRATRASKTSPSKLAPRSAIDADGNDRTPLDVAEVPDTAMHGVDGSEDAPALPAAQIHTDLDHDPIVKSLPVYLVPNLASKLALLQYPHKPARVGGKPAHKQPLLPPCYRELTDVPKTYARYKPRSGQLELSIPLEGKNGQKYERFDREKAEKYAKGEENSKDRFMAAQAADEPDQHLLQRTSMKGDINPDQTQYFVAAITNDEIHLTPLCSTLQMRVNPAYIEPHDDDRTRRGKKRADTDGESSEEDDLTSRPKANGKERAQEQPRAVQMSVVADENAAPTGPRGFVAPTRSNPSLFAPLRAAEAEDWEELAYYDQMHDETDNVYKQLWATNAVELVSDSRTLQHLF
ncbi:uncharacterized protein L969DRAFT_93307 [Mixia osmundae IAM 14324]|uniref:uncharacterized protein n=1 Tax=Mixia osmundae (strain CBS 9802 / IAM 14324 / JCM 22182 / KY 12970) TaxID=764103 RepID=UPI0004A55405|nr:uncharacterized protein L969DRAFT_93307 [Mixia osmundae IAM 14324]KEI40775.1 hypothetical protein L969DRAFT_93307 [Mixia osmundae IAM 14324]